jgi:hypothetical protein
MKLRLAALALILAMLSAVALVPAVKTHAANAPQARAGNSLSISGLPATFTTATGSGTITGITITGFQVVNGVLQAVGTATGTFNGSSFTSPFTAALTPAGMTCPILHLDIGPIFLNLLGLQVTTSQIVIDITAVSGPGNLLGNLLCAVAHLLDSSASGTALSQLLNHVAMLLNQLLGTL